MTKERETLDATCVNNEVRLQSKIIHKDSNRNRGKHTIFDESLVSLSTAVIGKTQYSCYPGLEEWLQ